MSFRLTRRAEDDILGIYLYTAETFGAAQADAYHDRLEAAFWLIADQPYLARQRTEIDPPVRIHTCGSHIVIYTVSPDDNVLIVRVRHHGSEDWQPDPIGQLD
jgi:toxin ParE1/3/4